MSKAVAEKCCESFKSVNNKGKQCIKAIDLYEKVYCGYCIKHNIKPVTQNMFGRIAKTRLSRVKTKDYIVYLAITPAKNKQECSTVAENTPQQQYFSDFDAVAKRLYESEMVMCTDCQYELPRWMLDDEGKFIY